jgi:hypothetical protein
MKRKNKLGMKREIVRVLTTENMVGVAGGVTTRPPKTAQGGHCTWTEHGSVCAE